jgi:hypothetical protein
MIDFHKHSRVVTFDLPVSRQRSTPRSRPVIKLGEKRSKPEGGDKKFPGEPSAKT